MEEGRRGLVWYSLQVCIVRTGCHLQYTYIESSHEPDSTPIHWPFICDTMHRRQGVVPSPLHDSHDFTNNGQRTGGVWFMRLDI